MLKKLVITAALGFVLSLTAGCGATCEDACKNMAECTKNLGQTAPTDAETAQCTTECEADTTCGDKKDEMIDCIADMDCSDQASALGELISCAAKCPGAFN